MASSNVEKMETSNSNTEATAGPSNAQSTEPAKETHEVNSQPICLIVLGMAGSGKTSFVQKLTQLGHLQNMKPYVINLDPACSEVPYHTNIGKIFHAMSKRARS